MCSLDNIKLEIDTEQGSDDAKELKVDICEHNLNYTILVHTKSEHIDGKNSTDILNYTILEDIKSEHVEENHATDSLNYTVLDDAKREHVEEKYTKEELDLNCDRREDIVEPELVQFDLGELNSTSGKCELLNSQIKSDNVDREYSSVANARRDDSNDQHNAYEYSVRVKSEIEPPTFYRECYVLLESINCDSSKLSRASEDNGQVTKSTVSHTSLGKCSKINEARNCNPGKNKRAREYLNNAKKITIEEDCQSRHHTNENEESDLSTPVKDSTSRNFIQTTNVQNRDIHNVTNAKGVDILKCRLCAFRTRSKPYLNQHVRRTHNPLPIWYDCCQCGHRTKYRHNLMSHIRTVHRNIDRPGSPEFCETKDQDDTIKRCVAVEQYANESRRDGTNRMENQHDSSCRYHAESLSGNKYQCKHCKLTRKHEQNRINTNDVKDEKLYKCLFCSYESKLKANFKRHLTHKHDPSAEWYQCYQCEHKTKDKSSLAKHISKVHRKKGAENVKKYQCKFCDFRTKDKSYLPCHVEIKHDPLVKWYHCSMCKFRNKFNKYLRNHFKRKHDDTYQGNGCEFRTTVEHRRKHHEKTDGYQCVYCGIRLTTRKNLLRHFTTKHDVDPEWFFCYNVKDEKLYKCQFCSYESKHKANVKRHFTLKHDPSAEWYHCYQCEHETKDKAGLAKHIRKVHRKKDAENVKITNVSSVISEPRIDLTCLVMLK